MGDGAYFQQVEQNITSLIAEGKYQSAYKLCVEYINSFPEEKRFFKLKEEIEEEVEKKNKKVIKEKLKEIDTYWKEENYAQILIELKKLLQISPNNKDLIKLYQKAQEKYVKKVKDMEQKFEKEQSEKFDRLLKEDENLFLDELFQLELNNPGNQHVLKFTKKYRNKLIREKIKDKEVI